MAIYLNGDADYLEIPYNALFNFNGKSEFSMSVWLNVTTIPQEGNIFDFRTGTNDMPEVQIGIDEKISFTVDTNGSAGGSYEKRVADTALTEGLWTHVACIYDGTNLYIYLGGSQDVSDPHAGTFGNYSENLHIGCQQNEAGAFFEGYMTDFAIWDKALTAPQISLIANSKIKGMPMMIERSNLLVYLPLDDNPIQTGINGLVFKDLANGLSATAVDADNDSLVVEETFLSYPQDICYVDAYSVVASGNIKKICGIPWANVKKVSGIAKANIKKIAGISAQ